MRKRIMICFLILLFVTGLSACGREKEEGSYSYQIYYVNKDRKSVV